MRERGGKSIGRKKIGNRLRNRDPPPTEGRKREGIEGPFPRNLIEKKGRSREGQSRRRKGGEEKSRRMRFSPQKKGAPETLQRLTTTLHVEKGRASITEKRGGCTPCPGRMSAEKYGRARRKKLSRAPQRGHRFQPNREDRAQKERCAGFARGTKAKEGEQLEEKKNPGLYSVPGRKGSMRKGNALFYSSTDVT